MRSLVMVLGVFGALGGTARADQCQLVDDDVADWAPKLLAKGVSFVSQCEPCGDKGPSQPKIVASVSVRAAHGAKQVVVNGKDIDLAYVFVQTGKWSYTNAALLLGCVTTGVSTSVSVKPAAVSHRWPAKVPQSCRDYEHEIQRLKTCDKLPQAARDALQQGFEAMTQTFDQVDGLPPEALKALADACLAGADALRQSGAASGCR